MFNNSALGVHWAAFLTVEAEEGSLGKCKYPNKATSSGVV